MKNPFRFGQVVDNEFFCNRQREIKEIHKAIHNGYSFWIYSPRRYGKTSLIRKAFDTFKGKVTFFYFDFYNIQTLDDFARIYSEAIALNLFDWKNGLKSISKKLGNYFKNLYPKVSFNSLGNPSFSLELAEIKDKNNIQMILDIPEKISSRKKICIAFDEFQEINRIEPFLINWMRSSFQKQENVSYVFLGSRQSLMESIFADTNSAFYEFGFKMPIQEISYEDLYNFIKERFHKTKIKIKKSAIDQILQKSKCHPHFTQYFASVVWEFLLEGADETDPEFHAAWMGRILNAQSVVFQNIYDGLNSNQRRVLMAIASMQKSEKLFSNDIKKRYKLPASSTLTVAAKGLLKQDIISKIDNEYQINNPVFEEWIRKL